MAQTKQIRGNMVHRITVSHSIKGWCAKDLQGNEGLATFDEGLSVAIERCKELQLADEVQTVTEAQTHKVKKSTKYDTFKVKRY